MGANATWTADRPDGEHFNITHLDRRAYGWILKGLELLENTMTRADEGKVGVKLGMKEEYSSLDKLLCTLLYEVKGG